MKRSEMVRLITAYINMNTHKTVDDFSGDYLCTLEEGDKVLAFIERQGMLPPERYRDKNWNELGITYSEWLQLPSKVNEWEEEDE